MVVALAAIWIGFHVLSGGDFLTARNLWNLSVQSTSIAIMATGMVLIIVSRNIDLSVGSLLGFLGYTMAMVQTEWIPDFFGLSVTIAGSTTGRTCGSSPCCSASLLGALIGGLQGFIVAYVGVPVVHRHARRLPRLARPDLPRRRQAGPDAGPARRERSS